MSLTPTAKRSAEEAFGTPQGQQTQTNDHIAYLTATAQKTMESRNQGLAARERHAAHKATELRQLGLQTQKTLADSQKTLADSILKVMKETQNSIDQTDQVFKEEVEENDRLNKEDQQALFAACNELLTPAKMATPGPSPAVSLANSRAPSPNPLLPKSLFAAAAATPACAILETLKEEEAREDFDGDVAPAAPAKEKPETRLALLLGTNLGMEGASQWGQVGASDPAFGTMLQRVKSVYNPTTGETSFSNSVELVDDCVVLLLDDHTVVPAYVAAKQDGWIWNTKAKTFTEPIPFAIEIDYIRSQDTTLLARGRDGVFVCTYKGNGQFSAPVQLEGVGAHADLLGIGPKCLFGFQQASLGTEEAYIKFWTFATPTVAADVTMTTKPLWKTRNRVKLVNGSDDCFFLASTANGNAFVCRRAGEDGYKKVGGDDDDDNNNNDKCGD